MPRLRWTVPFVIALTAVLGSCAGDDADMEVAASPASSLSAKTVEAGEVTVKITPVRVDGNGAEFKVALDTHSVDLDIDIAKGSLFTVAGASWGAAAWEGAEPGGHHREGTLRFREGSTAGGEAVLTIDGLPEPVRATWRIEGS